MRQLRKKIITNIRNSIWLEAGTRVTAIRQTVAVAVVRVVVEAGAEVTEIRGKAKSK